MQTIITFSGKAHHGKDSSALVVKRLLENRGERVLLIHYADLLKFIAIQYLNWDGNKDEEGRTLLQQLGTEKARSNFPDFWVDNVKRIVSILENDFTYVLIPDARFKNEIDVWKAYPCRLVTVHVTRNNYDNGLSPEQKMHQSEIALDDYQFDVRVAAETLDELEAEITTKVMDAFI